MRAQTLYIERAKTGAAEPDAFECRRDVIGALLEEGVLRVAWRSQ